MIRLARILPLILLANGPGWAGKFYEDDPLVQEPSPRRVDKAASRKLSDYYDALRHTLATPGEKQLRAKKIPAQGVNTLGDPMEGSWWERRHYWKRLSTAELQAGPGNTSPPATDGKWTVVAAKTEGITPGFVVLDRHKRRYFVKFDPPSNPELATAADQIASKLFYALGYHVPQNYIVRFPVEILEPGEDVTVEDSRGRKRKMTSRDITETLLRVHREPDGRYRATASLALPGKPIGPYRYYGTREDDPNDTVPHEHRRDLRAMQLACAWTDHDDSRSINTLDILTDGSMGKYVKHYQLDFGSTLGSASDKVNSPRSGGEYLFGWKQAGIQLASLGLAVPYWARAQYPPIPSVGRFESRVFDPERWVPEYPNPAFLNRLPDDEFWMAKQIANISDAEVRAIVETGEYSDPDAAEWVTRCLIERRDKIAHAAYSKVLPFDRFRLHNDRLEWDDLSGAPGKGDPARIQVQWSDFDNQRETSSAIAGATSPALPAMTSDGYWMALIESPARAGKTVRVYVRRRAGRAQVVGVEHTW